MLTTVSMLGRHTKLLAAVAEYLVVRTQVFHQKSCGFDQDLIPGRVAMTIVDRLEIIQIHHHQTTGMHPALHQFMLFAQFRENTDTGIGAGERVTVI